MAFTSFVLVTPLLSLSFTSLFVLTALYSMYGPPVYPKRYVLVGHTEYQCKL